MTMLWEIAEAALKREKDKEFRQKNHMVNAGRRRRVSQVRASGTSEGANKGWDRRGRGRAGKNFTPPSSVVHNTDKEVESLKKIFNRAFSAGDLDGDSDAGEMKGYLRSTGKSFSGEAIDRAVSHFGR